MNQAKYEKLKREVGLSINLRKCEQDWKMQISSMQLVERKVSANLKMIDLVGAQSVDGTSKFLLSLLSIRRELLVELKEATDTVYKTGLFKDYLLTNLHKIRLEKKYN